MKPQSHIATYSGGQLDGRWKEIGAPYSETSNRYTDDRGVERTEVYVRVMHHGKFTMYEHSRTYIKYVDEPVWKKPFQMDQYDRDDGRGGRDTIEDAIQRVFEDTSKR